MLKTLLDRPVTVTMGFLVVIVLGLVSIRQLPISLIPSVDVPNITVQVSAPDLSSRELDETVIRSLMHNLIQTSSLEEIRGESHDGGGTINMTFTQGADMDYAFIEVNEKIDRSMGSLGNLERPRVLKSSASDIPAFYVNLTMKEHSGSAGRTDNELYPVSDEFANLSTFATEVIARRIEQLQEVAMVDITGFIEPELLIIPDMSALRQAGITLDEFESYVKSADIRLGSLSIKDGEYRYNVKFQSFASSKEDIENIYINKEGRIFQLKDIAEVIRHPAKRTGLVRSDGEDAISMAVIKQSDAKMADLKKRMDGLMAGFSREYPEIEFKMTRDQTELLEYSINNLIQNIIVGIILACIVIFLFMQDFRSPALVALTIPTALIFSMLIFYAIGLSINIISLSGLVLGVGMMVDNTIVLTDNITARWLRGDDLRTAVLKGTKEVLAPMLSSVLTTCAVFIPLIFVSGIAGAMFYDQAMAITIVLLTAYVVTVTVIPVYYWCWYRNMPAFVPNRFLEKFSFNRVTGVYESGLKWLFRHRWAGWSLFAVSAAGIVLCFIFMPKSKLPEITYTDTVLKVDWNEHLTLEQNTERVVSIEKLAGKSSVQITSLVGMQQYILSHSGESSLSGASIYIKCDDARSLAEVKSDISSAFSSSWPEATFGFEASGNIFDMVFSEKEPDLVARLRPVSEGMEISALDSLLDKISAALPGISVPELSLKKDVLYVADPEVMALYGVSFQSLLAVLKNSLNENQLFSIVQGNQTLPVVMGVNRRNLSEIIDGSFVTVQEKEIPVSALMKQTWEEDLKSIVSGPEGNFYPLEIELAGHDAGQVMDSIRDEVHRDGNFDVSFSGSHFSNVKMINEMIIVLIISLILLYLILASQFESMVQPLIILSEIVIDIFFALLVLWICGVSVNLMSMIGLVVVCGIVINDSILKIDTINRLRREGMHIEHAVMEAGQRRLKAIVMTSLTTILSVCPFLTRGNMGDDLQYPMSLVIIAGMTAGTLISLFFVPIVYYEVYRSRK